MMQTITSHLIFKVGKEFFAANVSKVLEILPMCNITQVPHSPDYMRGVTNLRGSLLPVIDTHIKFGMPSIEASVNTCIVVLEFDTKEGRLIVGIIVDGVQQVVEINPAHIQPLPAIGSRYNTEFIRGMWKTDNQLVMILHIEQIFVHENIATLMETKE